jgi:hypothetical protein
MYYCINPEAGNSALKPYHIGEVSEHESIIRKSWANQRERTFKRPAPAV